VSIGNLIEGLLYNKLPNAVVTGDENGLVSAVIGGFQDRLSDLRSYTKKMGDFWTPGTLPETGNNAVLVDITGQWGTVYTRSLDIDPSTPPDGSPYLSTWAASQLGLTLSSIANVRYGVDLLRQVDANILSYLAATLGAVLHQSQALTAAGQSQAHIQLVNTWFPRLKIKGSAQSFEVLGRILGFDDVRYTPLWTRLSPRNPNDVGDPANDADFSAQTEYFPAQTISVFYDPFAYRDGAFFSWSGTASNGTSSTGFYPESIDGMNPWVQTSIVGPVANGTITHPFAGTDPATTYSGSLVLAGGLPELRASATDPNSGVIFQAIAEGDSFNGVVLNFATTGSLCVVSIEDNLSAIKYRSSYFDLGLTMDMDHAEELFGSRATTTNANLAANPVTVYGTAVSPYMPYTGGTYANSPLSVDWLSVADYGTSVTHPAEANPALTRQLNTSYMVAAGVQVVQAMEETRAATRSPRRSQVGFLNDDKAPYAAYGTESLLFTASAGTTVYDGTISVLPDCVALASVSPIPYVYMTWTGVIGVRYDFWWLGTRATNWTQIYAGGLLATQTKCSLTFAGDWINSGGIEVFTSPFTWIQNWDIVPISGQLSFTAESSPNNPQLGYYQGADNISAGTFNAATGVYHWVNSSDWPGAQVVVYWVPFSTEVIRNEPSLADKESGTVAYQLRAEDEEDDPLNGTLDAFKYAVDDFAWRRSLVVGGELADLDIYLAGTEVGIDILSTDTVFRDQSGAELNVYGVTSQALPFRYTYDTRPMDSTYQPGQLAIGYQGVFRDLSAYTVYDTSDPKPVDPGLGSTPGCTRTVYDTIFNGTYSLYHVGLCQGVLVADLPAFYGSHHRDGLVCWLPLDEHPEDQLLMADHSYKADVSTWVGLTASDRVFDPYFGWVLTLSSAWLQQTKFREIAEEASVAFWVNLTVAPLTEQVFVRCGPLKLTLTPGRAVIGYVRRFDGTYVSVGSTTAFAYGDWYFVYLTKDAETATLGYGTVSGGLVSPTALTGSFPLTSPDDTDQSLLVSASGASLKLHDLRLWNLEKSAADLAMVLNYQPTPTLCPYPLGRVLTLDRQDRYGLRVLGSGWVVLDNLPASYQSENLGLVRRYDSMGVYTGEDRYQETGLGGGRLPPAQYTLGQQTLEMTAYGTHAYSNQYGYLPGTNTFWSAITGSTAPELMAQTNVFRDKIWFCDLDQATKPLYVGWLDATHAASTPTLNYAPTDERAGAFVLPLRLSVLTGAHAYDGHSGLTPIYMYLESRAIASVNPAATAWTDLDSLTPGDNGVDPTDMPSIVGLDGNLKQPVIGENGVLEFSNSTSLPAGQYKLTITSGCVGLLDQDFDGFVVNLTLGSNVYAYKLLEGRSGYNIQGTDVFTINVPTTISGAYLFSVELTNALSDTSRGTSRQLIIYSYALRRMHTEPWEVQFCVPNPCTPILLALDATNTGTTPGGWLAAMNSYGTVASSQQESTYYPANDTVASPSPVSALLTGLTNDRMEDIFSTGTIPTLVDGTVWTLPTYTGLVLTPDYGLGFQYQTGYEVTFTAQTTGDTSGVAAYVWKWWDGTGTATPGPSATKILNQGSNPGPYGPQGLQMACYPTAVDGSTTVLRGTLAVNNGPIAITTNSSHLGAALTANDQYFSYQTTASVTVCDPDSNDLSTSGNVVWYDGATSLGLGTWSGPSTITVPWTVNGYTQNIVLTAYTNTFTTTVASDRVITCQVTDKDGGLLYVNFDLRGFVPANPVAIGSSSSGPTADASSLPTQRIGSGQTVEFTVYADDVEGVCTFGWAFYGTNGWNDPGQPVNPTNSDTTVLADGEYQNTLYRPIDNETVTNGTVKLCTAVCYVVDTNQYTGVKRVTEVDIPVLLEADSSSASYIISATVEWVPITSFQDVSRSAAKDIVFTFSGTDPNGDVVTGMWQFTQDNTESGMPTPGLYWGPKVVLNSTNYQAGDTIEGLVSVTDRFGASATYGVPYINITA